MAHDKCFLILGGAGLVGSQIVREICRHLKPERIIVASLYRGEVNEFLESVTEEFPSVEFIGAWGDVFVRDEFTQERRLRLTQSRARRSMLYDDLYDNIESAYERSALVQLIRQYKPDVIVDSINTATAISYQDVTSLSKRTRDTLDELRQVIDKQDWTRVEELDNEIEFDVSMLLISQSIPQLIRHVQLLHRAMCEVGTRLYLKIGTTGTGGMGLNIPYTHSEDKPSAKLMSKTAVAFAHTGLMFLMARTAQGPLVKEIKPAAMIGYRGITYETVNVRGRPQMRLESISEPIGEELVLRGNDHLFEQLEKLQMAGVDTGENGFFARGEFETITHINQMEFVTPEEIAQKAILEIRGSNTGQDVIAAIDGTVMTSSYRAGVLRQTALDQLAQLEEETSSHSVALGQLGPPELSKLLYEAHLLKLCYGTLQTVRETAVEEISETLYKFVSDNEELRTQITSIGVPILSPDGQTLIRGPRLNIPESIYHVLEVGEGDIDSWARKGWIDLRPSNFLVWQERFQRMERGRREGIKARGTASVTMQMYLPDTIEIGAVVAWIFNNDAMGYRIK
ncbi:MAG TPA: hypothetical protein VLL52_23320 [Anaerolineae bacterium]|nr:hypothetical protein [Anaerolineae bacterium]